MSDPQSDEKDRLRRQAILEMSFLVQRMDQKIYALKADAYDQPLDPIRGRFVTGLQLDLERLDKYVDALVLDMIASTKTGRDS